MVMHEYAVTSMKALNFFPDVSDSPNGLVAQHRRSDVEASNLFDICAAYSTGSHLHKNIARTYTRNRSILNPHHVWLYNKCGLHHNLPNQISEVAI